MKRFLSVLMITMIISALFSFPVLAPLADAVQTKPVPAPAVYINGSLRHFNPPALVVNNRTMVPLRFVMEDNALGGTVNWDSSRQEATVNCQEKTFIFKPNSTRVKVNEKICTLDTPAYVYQNRIYIPLRFLSEQLGARVSWDAATRSVYIRLTEQQRVVFGYYYYKAYDELAQHTDVITDLACRWYASKPTGDLYYEYQDRYEDVLKLAREKGIRTHLSVVLMGKDQLHTLLAAPSNRQRLVGGLCKEMRAHSYDGINIDFEFISPDDAGNFVLFLKELKSAMGQEKTLSVAVFGRTASDKWKSGYDYPGIGKVADQVVVMAYDYHYLTTDPGPIAPYWWVEKVAAYMVSIMPREKVLLGMPTYGYDWGEGVKNQSITAAKFAAIRQKYTMREYWDEASLSPYYKYSDESGHSHEIWFENEKSLRAKINIQEKYQLGGVSFWRVGAGFEDIYRALK